MWYEEVQNSLPHCLVCNLQILINASLEVKAPVSTWIMCQCRRKDWNWDDMGPFMETSLYLLLREILFMFAIGQNFLGCTVPVCSHAKQCRILTNLIWQRAQHTRTNFLRHILNLLTAWDNIILYIAGLHSRSTMTLFTRPNQQQDGLDRYHELSTSRPNPFENLLHVLKINVHTYFSPRLISFSHFAKRKPSVSQCVYLIETQKLQRICKRDYNKRQIYKVLISSTSCIIHFRTLFCFVP